MPRDYFALSNPDERMMMHISPIVFLQTRALTRISLLYGARIMVCGWSVRTGIVGCISRAQLPGIKSLKLVGLLVKRAQPVDWHVDSSSGMCVGGWITIDHVLMAVVVVMVVFVKYFCCIGVGKMIHSDYGRREIDFGEMMK